MDKSTMTISSQNFLTAKRGAIMAMTLTTALTMNANNYEDNQLLMTDGETLAYNQVICENTATQNKTYVLPQKKNFRERYKRISQTKWFKRTYKGKTLGEIITVEE